MIVSLSCLLFATLLLLKLFPNITTQINKNLTNYPNECFFCRHSNRERDILSRLDQHPECLSYQLFVNKSQFRRICTPAEHFCSVQT
uniref:Uncharacterized protein n=1 Tax=Meloidogyne enterolobii TaxID=390850 RepID=A0A6V7WPF4_MELEN|nr:unnamed protein product [Meloidogyne enterolobii]